jgi:hypothetical protein
MNGIIGFLIRQCGELPFQGRKQKEASSHYLLTSSCVHAWNNMRITILHSILALCGFFLASTTAAELQVGILASSISVLFKILTTIFLEA